MFCATPKGRFVAARSLKMILQIFGKRGNLPMSHLAKARHVTIAIDRIFSLVIVGSGIFGRFWWNVVLCGWLWCIVVHCGSSNI